MNDAPPPAPPPTGLLKRCKFIWRLLMLSNLALGAFLFARAKQRDSMENHRRKAQRLQKGKTIEVPPDPEPVTTSMDINYDDFLVPAATPVEMRAPLPEEQQREIVEWMLEEKRKVKPMDPAEKKQIDEEKDILKQFLRAESVPKS